MAKEYDGPRYAWYAARGLKFKNARPKALPMTPSFNHKEASQKRRRGNQSKGGKEEKREERRRQKETEKRQARRREERKKKEKEEKERREKRTQGGKNQEVPKVKGKTFLFYRLCFATRCKILSKSSALKPARR